MSVKEQSGYLPVSMQAGRTVPSLPLPVGVAAATSKLKEEEAGRSTRKAWARRKEREEERRTSDT